MSARLKGKRAFVTAAAVGIGRACALAFAREGATFSVTCSLGVAERSAEMQDEEALFEAADRSLYEAKGGGRNRVGTEVVRQ